MKKAVIICLMILLPVLGRAGNDYPRITFGAEWSYIAAIYSSYHYNYFSPDESRFNITGNEFKHYDNGEVLLHIGYNLDKYWNISAYTGLSGIADYHNSIPINLRITRYFGNNALKDRWFSFIDVGSGITIKKQAQAIMSAKLGAGYRISLSKDTKIDFISAIRNTYTQPQVYHEKETIRLENTNRNDAYILSLSLGIALTF